MFYSKRLPRPDHCRSGKTKNIPRWHIPVEQDIQLLISPVATLRDPVVRPGETDGSQSPKEEAQLSLHVGLSGVDHVGNGNGHDNADESLAAVATAMDFDRTRVAEHSEMITKQMGPTDMS